MLFDLVELRLVIERHRAYVAAARVTDVRYLLRRIGENDAFRVDAQIQHFAKFALSFQKDKFTIINRETRDMSQ